VLVAEDNATNQTLVEALLTQRGCTVVLVPDGQQAVEKASAERFDVILMDVQMPVMNGLEATHAIRRQEAGTGRRTPIVALTAHAMAGDREQCLAAGMDAYVVKPLREADLFAAIDALSDGAAGAGAPGAAPLRQPGAIDADALLASFGGNRALLGRVIGVFLTDSQLLLARLRAARQAGDTDDLAKAAHALKGSVGLFSQGLAYERTRRLEHLARNGSPDADLDAALADAAAAVNGLVRELETVRRPGTSPGA
jgi:CheY-like chemotaxis protein